MTERGALEAIARLGLESHDPGFLASPDYYAGTAEAAGLAMDALGWVLWSCSSRFTGCRNEAQGPEAELLAAGWTADERCPQHAGTVDPTSW